MWARLECTPTGPLFPVDPTKTEALNQARKAGTVRTDLPAADIHALVIALALAWSPASLTDTVDATAPTADHDQRRRSLAAAVRSAFNAA